MYKGVKKTKLTENWTALCGKGLASLKISSVFVYGYACMSVHHTAREI